LKINLRAFVVLSGAVALIGCGMNPDEGLTQQNDGVESAENVEGYNARLSIQVCGLTCPSGYYPTSSWNNYSCNAQGGVSTLCSNSYHSPLQTCGFTCPSGYYPTSSMNNPSCLAQSGVSTICSNSYHSPLQTCGFTCPSGYYPKSSMNNPSCLAQGGISTTCVMP
jgi:hypothetical protein